MTKKPHYGEGWGGGMHKAAGRSLEDGKRGWTG